jgi:hypothetical protein
MHDLAHLTRKSMNSEPASTAASLVALRSSLAALCAHVMELAIELSESRAAQQPGDNSHEQQDALDSGDWPPAPQSGSWPAAPTGAGAKQVETKHCAKRAPVASRSTMARVTTVKRAAVPRATMARASVARNLRASRIGAGNARMSMAQRRGAQANAALPRASVVRGLGRASAMRVDLRRPLPVEGHAQAPRAAAQAMARASAYDAAPRLSEAQASALMSSIGEMEVDSCSDELYSTLPLLMEVLQNVGDVFRSEELAHHSQEDLAKQLHSHDVVEDEVEKYSQLRKLVRLDKFSEPATAAKVLESLSQPTALTILDSLVRALATPNPGGEPASEEAQRQLIYFCNSLHYRRLAPPPAIARMKSITSFTPYYAEDVTYTEQDLYRKRQESEGSSGKGEVVREVTDEGEVTLLDLLRALFPDEWENFYERVELDTATLREHRFPVEELQQWASDRAQVLSRTIRGVQRYGDGLRLLARLEEFDEEEVEWLVATKFEYVVTCQIYGKQRRATKGPDVQKANAIDKLRRQFAANLRIAFVDDPQAEAEQPYFSSVLLGIEDGTGRDVTLCKIRLPGNPIIGEGKPENQNHAIVFAHGEYLQTLDMNQDNYLGESLKLRNLLQLFQGDVRIVGFPEHIFSVSGGAVAHFSGSNEIVFGSTVQRFLTWPLMVRFHYGHPDVWDKVWAISAGGVAKASRTLHVSEDIFGGFNVILRGGTIDYAEFIHCGKGRDMSFIAVNGFESKISAGAAVTSVSRDMLRLMRSFDVFRLFSFYCSMAGFYVTTLQSVSRAYMSVVAGPMAIPMHLAMPPCMPHALSVSRLDARARCGMCIADVVSLSSRVLATNPRRHAVGGVRAVRVC